MINYDLSRIRAFVFDVDGVLSMNNISIGHDGQPQRTANIKDGYALQLAVKSGLKVAIITGGRSNAVRERYMGLGITDIIQGVSVKVDAYSEWLLREGLKEDEVLYMGDDIPDYEAMSRCGLPACPADAAPEIRDIARYISPMCGGMGCVRDVIEQVLRAQGLWMSDEHAFEW